MESDGEEEGNSTSSAISSVFAPLVRGCPNFSFIAGMLMLREDIYWVQYNIANDVAAH